MFRKLFPRSGTGTYGPSYPSRRATKTRSVFLCLNPVSENLGNATRCIWTENLILSELVAKLVCQRISGEAK